MWEELTPRERMTAEGIGRGWTSEEIMRNLNIAESTQRHHVQAIREKLGLSSRTQIAVWMWREGRMA